jgi:hypothetical protein
MKKPFDKNQKVGAIKMNIKSNWIMNSNEFNTDETGMTLLHDWVKTYDFQKEQNNHPFSSPANRIVTVNIWISSGYDAKTNKTYGGMFAYSEVIDEYTGEIFFKQFFGETSEDDAFRWANDKAIKQLN